MNAIGLVLAMGCTIAGAPAPRDPLAAARDELAALYFWDAMVLAELALRTTPDSPAAVSLLAALCEASGDPRAGDLRARAGAAKMPPPVPSTRFEAGDRAFAAVALAPLRREPGASAAILAALFGNAGVEVLDVRGEWVKARWRRLVPGKRHVFHFAGHEAAEPAEEEELQGWLLAADLSPRALDAAALTARAGAALAGGQRDDAFHALRLGLAARPDDEKLRRAFIRQALEAGYERLAAQTAWQRRRGGLRVDAMEVDAMEVYYGCRGDRARAAVVRELTDEQGVKRMPEDACVQRVDPQKPCEVRAGKRSGNERFERWRRRLDATFTKPHWLRVSVTNRRSSDVAELWVLRDDEPPPTCGDAVDYGPPEEAWRVEIPPIASGAGVDLWFELPTYLGQRFQLSTSRQREDVVAETATPGVRDCEALCD